MENDEILEETSGEKEELFEHFRFVVDPGTEIIRLDRYLTNLMAHTSRNRIQQAAKADCILVNDRPVKSNYRVHPRDVISILLPRPVHVFELVAEDIPLDIVYEDEDVILINKPAGMVVHPAVGNFTGTLVNALLWHFQGQRNAAGEEVKPLLVHRIDKNTSGIMIVAKNELAQMTLAKRFFICMITRTQDNDLHVP